MAVGQEDCKEGQSGGTVGQRGWTVGQGGWTVGQGGWWLSFGIQTLEIPVVFVRFYLDRTPGPVQPRQPDWLIQPNTPLTMGAGQPLKISRIVRPDETWWYLVIEATVYTLLCTLSLHTCPAFKEFLKTAFCFLFSKNRNHMLIYTQSDAFCITSPLRKAEQNLKQFNRFLLQIIHSPLI